LSFLSKDPFINGFSLSREISYDEEEGEFEEGVERIFDPYYYLELGKCIITTVPSANHHYVKKIKWLNISLNRWREKC
jgi:hypothetical protein